MRPLSATVARSSTRPRRNGWLADVIEWPAHRRTLIRFSRWRAHCERVSLSLVIVLAVCGWVLLSIIVALAVGAMAKPREIVDHVAHQDSVEADRRRRSIAL